MRAKPLLVLDACVVINLAATGEFDPIARTLETQFWISRQASLEVGSLRMDVEDTIHAVPIDLDAHVAAGTLTIVDLRAEELALYVDVANDIGDGEAASIAIAVSRHLDIATDDRKARRVCIDRGLLEPVRTSDLVREYCDQRPLEAQAVGEMLRKVRDHASFVPPRTDPNLKWWASYIST